MLRAIINRAPGIAIAVLLTACAARAGTPTDPPERNVAVLVSCGTWKTGFTQPPAILTQLSLPIVTRRSPESSGSNLPSKVAHAHDLVAAEERPLQKSSASPQFGSCDLHPGRAPPLA